MDGAPRYVTASVRKKLRTWVRVCAAVLSVYQYLCIGIFDLFHNTSQSDTGGYSSHLLALQLTNTSKPTLVCSIIRFYSFAIVHYCACRTQTGPGGKKGGWGLGVGGRT